MPKTTAKLLMLSTALLLLGCGDSGCLGSGCGTARGGDGGVGGSNAELEVTTILSGLDKPWDIAWLPNGTMLVTERPGRVNVYMNGVTKPPFVIEPDDVVPRGEGGMMGLEVDPEFSGNGYVYVCTTSDASGDPDVRLVRYTLRRPSGDAVIERADIVTGMPYSTGRHSGCRPRFGPDGFLWVGTGDAAIYTTPQDDDSLGGKVLRVDREGRAAPGNSSGYRWISKGHRNVQGIAFRADGLGVSAEHGPSVDDELNPLVPGNFGWAPGPGYDESVPMTDLERFPEAVEAIWSSGSPTLALSGAAFLDHPAWGDWDGALTVATLKAQHLRLYFLDGRGRVVGEQRLLEGHGRLRSPRQGPDGALYISTDGSGDAGEILRVTPGPATRSPG